jgi:hypothetical protein
VGGEKEKQLGTGEANIIEKPRINLAKDEEDGIT